MNAQADAAIKLREKFHWGLPAGEALELPKIEVPKFTTVLGYLKRIGYVTQKAGDDDPLLYVHDFENDPNLPLLLACPKTGQLLIHRYKSKYRIEPRGIVG
jgi:hypothetical protein